MTRYHPSDHLRVGIVLVDSRTFRCPSCPFIGGEDAMVQHAMDCGHVALPVEKVAQPAQAVAE